MGCNSSSMVQFEPQKFDKIWEESLENQNTFRNKKIIQYSGWKILRIVLISTFKDFRNERSQLHNLIEVQLQAVANKKNIYLQLEDFNSNYRAVYDDPESVYLLVHLLTQCRKEQNDNPVYIHFLGECAGFVIDNTFPDINFLKSKGIQQGMTLNEMAVILARQSNDNALFLYRDPSFLVELPFNNQNFTEDEVGRERAQYLAKKIKQNKGNFQTYSCHTEGINNAHQKQIVLVGLEEMEKIVKNHIMNILGDFQHSASDKSNHLSSSLYKKARSNLPKELENIYSKLEKTVSQSKNVIVTGTYGSGKTTILQKLADSTKNSQFFGVKGDNKIEEVQADILNKLGKTTSDYTKVISSLENELILIIDNADNLGKKVEKLFVNNSKVKLVLSMRKSHAFKQDHEITFFPITSLSHRDSIITLAKYMQDGDSTNVDQIRPEIREQADRLYFEACLKENKRTNENVEEGKDDVHWTLLKCRSIGSLIRFGATLEKATRLASFNTYSVCEAELAIIESEAKGHLLIAVLCFLTIIEDGLTEMEIEHLLFPEENLLPMSIQRKFRNLPFEYDYEQHGNLQQIAAIRRRYVLMRLEHWLYVINENTNHVVLDDLIKKVVTKKFLQNAHHISHFKKTLERLVSLNYPWIVQRRSDLKQFL